MSNLFVSVFPFPASGQVDDKVDDELNDLEDHCNRDPEVEGEGATESRDQRTVRKLGAKSIFIKNTNIYLVINLYIVWVSNGSYVWYGVIFIKLNLLFMKAYIILIIMTIYFLMSESQKRKEWECPFWSKLT
jgi:hypothetical protein